MRCFHLYTFSLSISITTLMCKKTSMYDEMFVIDGVMKAKHHPIKQKKPFFWQERYSKK